MGISHLFCIWMQVQKLRHAQDAAESTLYMYTLLIMFPIKEDRNEKEVKPLALISLSLPLH